MYPIRPKPIKDNTIRINIKSTLAMLYREICAIKANLGKAVHSWMNTEQCENLVFYNNKLYFSLLIEE